MKTPEAKAKARLALAYAIAIVGTQRELAHRITLYFASSSTRGAPLSISAQAVQLWLARSTMLSEPYWPAIEHITDYQVTRRQLRPDLYNSGPTAPLPEGQLLDKAREILAPYEAQA